MLSVASCHGNRENLQPWDFWITLPHLSFRKHCCPFFSSWSSRGLWIGKTLDTGTKIRWPVERHARARKVFTSCGIWNNPWGKRQWYWWIVDEKPCAFLFIILRSWKNLYSLRLHIVVMKVHMTAVSCKHIESPVNTYSHLETHVLCYTGIF